jgi:hypothetical protein
MAYNQVQKIEGSAAANFGKKVAINGYYSIIADDSGNGYLYKRNINGIWEEESTFTIGGAGATFGNALDIGNEYFVVGESGYSSSTGRVGVYAINDPGTLIQTLSSSSLVAGDNFGDAVTISDDYILVGAYGADSSRGDVYLFIKDTGSTWIEYSGNPITSSNRMINDLFGGAVAINNDDLIVGAEGDNNKTGAIYIFRKNEETELWEQSQKIFASDGYYNDQFGESISASGNYFIAGASLTESSTGDANAGNAYIYKYENTWYEIDKLIGTGESTYVVNHFGECVDINGNYIIVGSPLARTTGVADVFYKKRSWGHLKKIIGDDSELEDIFGTAVGISGRFVIVGASSSGVNGAVYYYEDSSARLRLAQEFSVNGEYLPSKASIYLKRAGQNSSNYWAIYTAVKTVIDATNFSTLTYGDNIITFSDTLPDFTGNGYMISMDDTYSTFSSVNYPIRAIAASTFNLWIRCISTISDIFQTDILLDGKVIKTINETISDPSVAEWSWVNTTIVLPDNREHILGISIKNNGAAIDKICIDSSDAVPYSEGPDYGESPYLTVHMQIYDSIGESPNSALHMYDYKNSITEIVQSDWYNFDINVLDANHGYTSKIDFVGNYFLVLSCSGTAPTNFVVWEMMDNDEYMTSLSAFRF